jgi:phytoene synthase
MPQRDDLDVTRSIVTIQTQKLRESLPTLQRLALTYAPAETRELLLAFLALDARLANIVRSSHEPILAQLRLAWWREQLECNSDGLGSGDPLLATLHRWPGPKTELCSLVDGWEKMTGPPPLSADIFIDLAEARGQAFAALTDSPRQAAIALRMGRSWALADIAIHLSDLRERDRVLTLVRSQNWGWQRLPRKLRPLAVLHGLAARTNWQNNDALQKSIALTPGALLVAIRIGMTGR